MAKVKIITGKRHSGKTTFLLNHIKELRNSNITVAGIVAIGTFKNDIRNSFMIKDISTELEKLFMTRTQLPNAEQIGRFYINNTTYHWGLEILEKSICSDIKTIVIDEIGILELKRKGWHSPLLQALQTDKNIIITIRNKFINDIVQFFNIDNYEIITL